MKEKQSANLYNAIARQYKTEQDKYFKKNGNWPQKLLFRNMPNLQGKKVVDMGCGSGYDISKYKAYGAEVLGIDISERMLKIAKKENAGTEFMIGGYEAIPLAESSIDIVSGGFSLHYLTSFDKAYYEVHRVLKPDGEMVILVPHPESDKRANKVIKDNKKMVELEIYKNVVVYYPPHTMDLYFSETFNKLFKLIKHDIFKAKGIISEEESPVAMVIRAKKRTIDK